MSKHESLERTCKQLVDSLVAGGGRHTLCLNIAEEGFSAEEVAATQVAAKNGLPTTRAHEPTPTEFAKLLGDISGKTLIVTFDDLDKHPKCIDLLAEHVKAPDPGGRLVVVSRHWNSDNTDKERELRRSCLFYQQSAAPPPSKRK